MKTKLFYILSFILVLSSCSNDREPQNEIQNFDPNTILPKKIIIDDTRTGYVENSIYQFFYNGSKLNNIEAQTSDFERGNFTEGVYNFTYTGNFITKIEYIDNFSQFEMYVDFTYNNNKLVNKKFFVNNSLSENFDYIHNTNSITRNKTSFDEFGNPVLGIDGNPRVITDNFTITNNLITIYNFVNIDYSSTNSPFKNIIGVKDAFVEGGVEDEFSDIFDIFFSTQKNILNNRHGVFSYIYNNIEFPTTVMYFDDNRLNFNKPKNYNIIYQ
jgi:hypothetical protein